jgi:hypothetical protein
MLIKAEGDVILYRNNVEINIQDRMDLNEDDIINTVSGTVLIQILNEYAVITGKTAKIINNTKINIREEELSQILSGEITVNQFISLQSEASISRNLNMNLFIILDVSTSIKDVFFEVIKYIDENIIESIILDNDYVFLFTFGEYTDIKINRKISLPDDYSTINELLYSLVPDGEYTDIGLALETLDSAIANQIPYGKSIIFFITDGINNPAPDSKYYGFDIYKEGSFNAYTQVKSEDFKVMLLSIGEETAAKDLSEPLSGEYLEVSKEMNAGEVNNLITDFLGAIEMIVPADLGSISANEIELKVSFLSSYENARGIKISDIRYFIDDFNSVISIKGNDLAMEMYTLILPEDMESGEHSIKIEVDSENNVVTRPVQNINFTYFIYVEHDMLFLLLLITALICNLAYFVFAFFNIVKK